VQAEKEEKVLFELTNESEIKVHQPVQFVPVTELSDNGIINILLKSIWS
jgi:cell division protein FtsZ